MAALAQTPRAACFPVETLSQEKQAAADKLFWKILDSEALYTVIGGVKPVSSGFVRFSFDAEAAEFPAVDEARELLRLFRCGDELAATVLHFAKTYPNKQDKLERPFEGYVIHGPAMRRKVGQHRGLFAGLGVSPASELWETLVTVEYQPEGPRWRAYGLLYGYPPDAVDFFVQAGETQRGGGKFVERDFVSLPTFERAERGVVYAVPKGSKRTAEEELFASRVGTILAEYRARRERHTSSVALLREWFCGEAGPCRAPAAP